MTSKFVVLTRGRTGSTLICDTLDKLEGILCGQELLRPLKEEVPQIKLALSNIEDKESFLEKNYARDHKSGGGTVINLELLRLALPEINLSDYHDYIINKNPINKSVGFKVLTNHLGDNPETILKGVTELAQHSVKILYLQRRDVLREAFSSGISKERKIYNVKADEDHFSDSSSKKIHVSPEYILDQIKYINYWRNLLTEHLNSNNIQFKAIYFEDFLEDKRAFLYDVLTFLDVESADSILDKSDFISEGFLKVTPDNLVDLVINYEEVVNLVNKNT